MLITLTNIPFNGYTQDINLLTIHKSKFNKDSLLREINLKKESRMKNIKNENSHFYSDIRKEYDIRTSQINNLLSQDIIFQNDSIGKYLQDILEKIESNNPFLGKRYNILLSIDLEPNAYSIGEGIIIINTGLLTKYKNGGDLAFIICHEISHDYLNHSINGMITRLKIKKEKDYEKRYRKLRKDRYGKSTNYKNLYDELAKSINVYSKKNELEADSLGCVLLKNAGYNSFHAINSLSILKHCDDYYNDKPIDIVKSFHSSNYPFKNEWLITDTHTKKVQDFNEENDSLRTHPDCAARIFNIISNFSPSKKGFISEDNFKQQTEIANLENLNYLYKQKNYTLSLYFALYLRTYLPKNDYLTMVICHCMQKIGSSLKEHTFSKVVPMPNPDYDVDLNLFINFIHNLEYNDFKNLTLEYYNNNIADISDSKYKSYAKIYANSVGLSDAELIKKFEIK